MTNALDNIDEMELLKFVAACKQRFGEDMTEYIGRLSVIWMVGVLEKLAHLGVVGGGELKVIHGMDMWDQIDRFRFYVLPPHLLDLAIKPFAEAVSEPHVRKDVISLITTYYSDAGRRELTGAALEYLFDKEP